MLLEFHAASEGIRVYWFCRMFLNLMVYLYSGVL